jgi:tetratricopeptide (TPR) repeat protein
MDIKKALFSLPLILVPFPFYQGEIHAYTKEELIKLIEQLKQAGWYSEAQKYEALLKQMEQRKISDTTKNIEKSVGTNPSMSTEETNNIPETSTTIYSQLPKDIWDLVKNNPEKAIQILKKYPKTPEVLKALGMAYYNYGDYFKAIEYLNSYIHTPTAQSDPYLYKLYLLLAYAYKNVFDDAHYKQYLMTVYQNRPQILNPGDKLAVAYILLNQGRFDEVRELINSLTPEEKKKLPLEDLKKLYSLYYLKLGFAALKKKEYNLALKYAELAQKYEPNNKEVDELKAWIYLNTGLYKQAVQEFLKVLRFNPSADNYYGIALAYAKMGDYQKARQYAQLAERKANRILLYKLAHLYYDIGDKRKALQIIEKLKQGIEADYQPPTYTNTSSDYSYSQNPYGNYNPYRTPEVVNPTPEMNNPTPIPQGTLEQSYQIEPQEVPGELPPLEIESSKHKEENQNKIIPNKEETSTFLYVSTNKYPYRKINYYPQYGYKVEYPQPNYETYSYIPPQKTNSLPEKTLTENFIKKKTGKGDVLTPQQWEDLEKLEERLIGIKKKGFRVGFNLLNKDGRPGLDERTLSEVTWELFWSKSSEITSYELYGGIRMVDVSAGTLTADNEKYWGFGQTDLNPPPSFSASGAAPYIGGYYKSGESGWVFEGYLGLTPSSFTVGQRLEYEFSVGRKGYFVTLYRKAVKDSYLSYVGCEDNGTIWGGVMRNGIKLGMETKTNDTGIATVLDYAYNIKGQNTIENSGWSFTLLLYKELQNYFQFVKDFKVAIGGPMFIFQSYKRNTNFFTYGHGGYFSPQNFIFMGLFGDFQKYWDNDKSYFRVVGNVGMVSFYEQSEPKYPLSDNNDEYYPSNRVSTLGFSIKGFYGKLISKRLSMNLALSLDRSKNYTEMGITFFVSYFFNDVNRLTDLDQRVFKRFDNFANLFPPK